MKTKLEEPEDINDKRLKIFECSHRQIQCECLSFPAEVMELVSSSSWLRQYGLKTQHLDLFHLLPTIGFKLSDDYQHRLHKAVTSRYSEGMFPQVHREDGKTFNIVCCKTKLECIAAQLEASLRLYRQRLLWLLTGSRRVFGVVAEKSGGVVLVVVVPAAAATAAEKDGCSAPCCSWAILKHHVSVLLTEQVTQMRRFNIVLLSKELDRFRPTMMPVSHESIQAAVEWLQDKPCPDTPTMSICELIITVMEEQKAGAIFLIVEGTMEHFCLEILKDKLVKSSEKVPVHTVALNCTSQRTISRLRELAIWSKARFHMYNTDDNNFTTSQTALAAAAAAVAAQSGPRDGITDKEPPTIETHRAGAVPNSCVSVREDMSLIFDEVEEARNTYNEIKCIIDSLEPKTTGFDHDDGDDDISPQKTVKVASGNEPWLSSERWLHDNGIHANQVSLWHVLRDTSFPHRHASLNLLIPPLNRHTLTPAVPSLKVIDAKYCSMFPLVKLPSGHALHLYITPEFHRQYQQRMAPVLKNIRQR
ncbi:von Willebrand factor A domain-containing protein 3B-like isoform X1 [Argonauta hians]